MTMNVKLIIENGGRRRSITLHTPIAVLGRAHGNAVRIPSAEVSRRHCRLLIKDGVVTVEDLESVNGTFLNGKKLKAAQLVRPGDLLEVGPVAFTVSYQLSAAARKRLQEEEDSAEVLEALVDGEVVDPEDVSVAEPMDEDPLGLGLEQLEAEPIRPKTDPLAPLKPDFDFAASPWELPSGDDLRDLLEQIEEEPPNKPNKPSKSNKPSKPNKSKKG